MNENKSPLQILIDTSPLANANAFRGVGIYTQFLTEYLAKEPEVTVHRSASNQQLKFKPDLVHYPFFDFFFNTLPFNRPAKTVVTVHDVIPLIFPEYYPAGIKGKLKLFKQKKTLQTVDAVITDSLASKNDIAQYLQIKAEKIHVVYLAANPQLQAADEKDQTRVKRKYQLPKNYILYVGDINYNKNIPQLIKALYYLPPQIKLVCVGKNFYPHDIPEWHWIESQIAAGQLENRVKFLTNILGNANEDLAAIYSAALVYVQASLYEGFGLPILEAMQCKTPVVCSQNSSLKEIGDEYVHYTQPEAKDIAEAVKQILALKIEERATLIQAAYTWSSSFTWQKTAQDTIKVYQSIL